MRVSLIVPGKPMGKQRVRTLKSGITYTPKETVNYETYIKELYAVEVGEMLKGPISMTLIAYFPIPESTSKKKRTMMLNDEILPTKKPDIDNVLKITMDALNGVAYADDKQVTSVMVCKFYDEQPRLEIVIAEQEETGSDLKEGDYEVRSHQSLLRAVEGAGRR